LKIRKFWNGQSGSTCKQRLYCGIDPGQDGAFAALDEDGQVVGLFGFDKLSERDLFDGLMSWMSADDSAESKPMWCMLERVGARPLQGVASSFKFGMSYGFVRCALFAAAIPFDEVTPAKWQEKMRCPKGEKKDKKKINRERAQQLFPDVYMTLSGEHAVADALLIAEYGRRLRLGLNFI